MWRPVGLAVLTWLLLAAPASAAVVGVEDGVLTLRAAPGEVNDVELSLSGGAVDVTDDVPLVPGPGCAPAAEGVRCSGFARILVELGDGDDRARLAGARAEAHGGAGDDDILGAEEDDTLYGEAGNDRLHGGHGSDVLEGGDGNDRLGGHRPEDPYGEGADDLRGGPGDDWMDGHRGADTFSGGDGSDTVAYSNHSAPVTVRLGSAEPAGGAGEGDRIGADVENAAGGEGDDHLVGDARPNTLGGHTGADVIEAGDGDDVVHGSDGADRIAGEGGADELDGAQDADVLDGGPGVDRFSGGGGADVLLARDGAGELAACGAFRDRAVLDRADGQTDCERREWPDGVEEDPPLLPIDGSWDMRIPFSSAGMPSRPTGLFNATSPWVTPTGDVVHAWHGDDGRLRVAVWRPGAGAADVETLDTAHEEVRVAGDEDGRVFLLAAEPTRLRSGPPRVYVREPGGRFGAPHALEGAGIAAVAMAADDEGGAAAFTWSYEDGLFVTRRAPDGTWDETKAMPGANPDRFAVGRDGDVFVAGGWGGAHVGAVTPAGRVVFRRLSPEYVVTELAAGAGEALVSWAEPDRVGMARWDGGAFVEIPVAWKPYGYPPVMAIAGDGEIWLARRDPWTAAVNVLRGPSVTQLATVARFDSYFSTKLELALATDKTAVVAWQEGQDEWLSASRGPGEGFGPVQDLQPDCVPAHVTGLVALPGGRATALLMERDGERSAALSRPFAGAGLQRCLEPHHYGYPPDPPYFAPPDAPTAVPPPPPSAAADAERDFPPRAPSLLSARLGGSARRPVATLRMRCPRACRLAVSARLLGRTRALASGRSTRSRRTRTATVKLRLRPMRGAALRPEFRYRLRVTVAATGDGAQVTRRTFTRGVRLAR